MTINKNEWLLMRQSGRLTTSVLFDGLKLNKTVNQKMTIHEFSHHLTTLDSMFGNLKQRLIYSIIDEIDRFFNLQILLDRDNEQIWIEPAA